MTISQSVHPLERKLREALSDTSEEGPRAIVDLELPFDADKLLPKKLLDSLKPAAVLVPVLRTPEGPRVLFTRRAEHLRNHSGQISFPGGRRDEGDETAAANALREAQEEVGLDPAGVEVIGYLDDYPTITGYRVTPVVGVVGAAQSWKYDAGEVAGVFETPLAFVLDEQNFERKAFTRSGVNVPFFEINYRDEAQHYRIWGATAGMLWNLCNIVRRHEESR